MCEREVGDSTPAASRSAMSRRSACLGLRHSAFGVQGSGGLSSDDVSKGHLPDIEQWSQSSGSNVIPRRAPPDLAGLVSEQGLTP